MQCIPIISNTNGYPTVLLPLLIVVLIDAIFQIIEDVSRHKADAEANASPAYHYDHKTETFIQVKWYEIQVGDFIKVNNRETVPADIITLAVCEKTPESPMGVCYVETKSLDGETNLKIRNALSSTFRIVSTALYL